MGKDYLNNHIYKASKKLHKKKIKKLIMNQRISHAREDVNHILNKI